MVARRSCLIGRLGAVVLFSLIGCLGPARASEDVLGERFEESRAQLLRVGDRPESAAYLAALVRDRDYLPSARIVEALREFVDRKAGAQRDPLVRAQAAYWLSLEEDRLGLFSEAEAHRKELGLAGDAWVIGPFDAQGRSGLPRVFPVEEELAILDPTSGHRYPGKDHEVGWRRVPGQAFVQGGLLLDAMLRPDSDAAAYVLLYVTSTKSQWAALRVGSSGPVKGWLDQHEVFSKDVVRPSWPDQDVAPLYLARGTHRLLVKSVNTRGAWRLFVRLTSTDGRALSGVSFGVDSPPSAHAQAREAVWPRKPAVARNLAAELQGRVERGSGENSARAWLDQALFLSLVQPEDSEKRAIEAAAKKAVDLASAETPSNRAEALEFLGTVAREEDDRRQAFERALALRSRPEERAILLAEIGRIWRRQHRDSAAVASFREAVALDPGCLPAQLALAQGEARAGLGSLALTRLSGLPESVRTLPLVRDALSDVLASLGRRAESEKVERQVFAERRTDVGVLRALALVARARGDVNEAATCYAEASRFRPDLTSLIFDWAGMLEAAGKVEAARDVLLAGMSRLPDDPGIPEELGRLEARAGRVSQALASMRESLRLRPQNPGLRRYMESLSEAQRARSESQPVTAAEKRSIDELAQANAADGEALARAALFGPASADAASAEILLDRTVVRVHPNGLSERFVQRLVHVRTERAARDSQETWVRFEPGRQEVEIRKARVLRRAGEGKETRIDISEASGRDERNLSEPWYGLYYDTRAWIVRFENLRQDDVIEVQYTIADVSHQNELADYFGDFQMIADVFPCRRWDYTLLAPKERGLFFNSPRLPGLASKATPMGEEIRYGFVAENVPRIDAELAMPGFAEVAPYLHVSTYRAWKDVGRWYWNLVADQTQDDGSLKAAAVKATAGLSSTLGKVKAVHRLVVEKTRYVGLEFGIHGYKPYPSTQVLRRGFGDCKDKATLIMTLLRAVGVDSELVLLRTRRGGRIDETPASLAVFDHAIAYVPALDLYLDGTAEFSGVKELPAQDQDTMALRVSAKGSVLVRTPVLPARENLANRVWNVEVHGDGSARIAETLSVVGQAAHEWRAHYQTEGERRERYAKVWSGRFPGTRLDKVDMDVTDRNRPSEVRSEVRVPRLGEWRGLGELALPTSSRESDFTSTYARLGQRHFALVLGYPWRHEERVDYHLPEGSRMVHVPASRTLTSRFGSFTLALHPSSDGRNLRIESVFTVEESRIEPEDYADFRAFLRDTDAALSERAVIAFGEKS